MVDNIVAQLYFNRAAHAANVRAGDTALPVWQLRDDAGNVTTHHEIAGEGWRTRYEPQQLFPDSGVVAWIEIAGPVVVK